MTCNTLKITKDVRLKMYMCVSTFLCASFTEIYLQWCCRVTIQTRPLLHRTPISAVYKCCWPIWLHTHLDLGNSMPLGCPGAVGSLKSMRERMCLHEKYRQREKETLNMCFLCSGLKTITTTLDFYIVWRKSEWCLHVQKTNNHNAICSCWGFPFCFYF